MDLHVDDDGFVRAPAAVCYRTLTRAGEWSTWWPDTQITTRGADRFTVRHGRLLQVRLDLALHGWRHDTGFRIVLSGDLSGTAEFWLEPGWGGTVVHHLATCTGATARHARRYRRWVRRGLWGLKDHVQGRVLAEAAP